MSPVRSTGSESSRPYLTCREMLDFLMAYLDNELNPDERFDFDRHLNVCPSCRNYLVSYQHVIKLSRTAMADLDMPGEAIAPKSLVDAIRDARRKAM